MTGTQHAVHLCTITNLISPNLTKSIQGAWPLSKQNSSSCISCNPAPLYSLDRGPPQVLVLTQIPSYFLNMNLNITLPSTSSSYKCSQSFRFSYQPWQLSRYRLGHVLDGLWFNSRQRRENFLLSNTSWLALKPTQCVSGGKVDRGVKVTTHWNLLERLRMGGALSLLLPLIHSNGVGTVQLSFLYILLWPSSLVNDINVNKLITCEHN